MPSHFFPPPRTLACLTLACHVRDSSSNRDCGNGRVASAAAAAVAEATPSLLLSTRPDGWWRWCDNDALDSLGPPTSSKLEEDGEEGKGEEERGLGMIVGGKEAAPGRGGGEGETNSLSFIALWQPALPPPSPPSPFVHVSFKLCFGGKKGRRRRRKGHRQQMGVWNVRLTAAATTNSDRPWS